MKKQNRGNCPPPKRMFRGQCLPPAFISPLGGPASGLFSNGGSSGTEPVPPTPTPIIPLQSCKDTLTVVPFTVPIGGGVTPVSGGGNALAFAVTLAPPGAHLQIMDSLNYNAITLTNKVNLTIDAAPGQTPSITATPGNNQHCVTFGNNNNGVALRGLTFIGTGNAQAPPAGGQAPQGLVNYNNSVGGLRRLIIEDCTFMESAGTVMTGAPAIWLRGTTGGASQQDISIHRCRFIDNGNSAAVPPADHAAVIIGGFSNVYIQNCEIARANVALGASTMNGLYLRVNQGVVEDVFVNNIGMAAASRAFFVPLGPAYGTTNGLMSFRNCVAYNTKIGYGIEVVGSSMAVQDCVYYADTPIASVAVFYSNGALTFRDSVSFGAGTGLAFTADPIGSPIVEDHNDIFNFASNGRTLSPTDISVNPLFGDVPNGSFVATAQPCQTAASDGGLVGVRYDETGEKIIWCNH